MPEHIPTDPNPTLSNLSGLEGVYGDQLKEDQSQLADVNQDIANIPQFTEQEPRINPNGVMATMPFLIGLAALGGSFAGVHAKTMLSATNGMTKGLIQGNQKAYEDAHERYQESYRRYIDKHQQQLQIYNEMRQVYKGRVDADLRALEIARKATGDQTKVDQNALHGWQWEQEQAAKLKDAEEKKRHDMATEPGASTPGTGKAPVGFEWDPEKPGALRPIKGGPKDPSAPGVAGAREAVFIGRMTTSANEALKDVSNIVKLPISSETGIFGSVEQGKTLTDSPKAALANTMTSQESQLYQVMAAGVQRNLASIEAVGLMPSGSLTHQMDAVIFRPGDTGITKLSKLAQIRQIAEGALEIIVSNPRVSSSEKDKVHQIIDGYRKAIPWTNEDVIQLQQSSNPRATIQDFMGAEMGGAQSLNIEDLVKKYGKPQ